MSTKLSVEPGQHGYGDVPAIHGELRGQNKFPELLVSTLWTGGLEMTTAHPRKLTSYSTY